MLDYQIAIPSFRRADTLRQKTWPILQATGADLGRLTLFLDADDVPVYREAFPELHPGQFTVAPRGIGAVRNCLHHYYPEGTPVLALDDDLIHLNELGGKRFVTPANLDALVEQCFEFMRAAGASLWGIYPTDNPRFMGHQLPVTRHLTYICGSFYGFLSTSDRTLDCTLDDKEDFERSIKYYLREGQTIRFNHYGLTTRYYREPGGMQVERTYWRILESARYLARSYPDLCTLNLKGQYPEVELRDKRLSPSLRRKAIP